MKVQMFFLHLQIDLQESGEEELMVVEGKLNPFVLYAKKILD